jgi:hypothetical protein
MFKLAFRTIFALIISITQLFSLVFDKDEEVRAFRTWAKWNKPGANITKVGDYEALDILNFIADKGLTGSAIPPALLQHRDQQQYLISIAHSILQGRGFDKGVINQPVTPADMRKYRDAVAAIGQHVNRASATLVSAEIFNTTPGPYIDEHVRIANELLKSKAPTPSLVEPLYTREGFIRSEAAIRDATFWRYARADGDVSSLCGDVEVYTTDTSASTSTSTIAHRRFSPLLRTSTSGRGRVTPIHYNVYISRDVRGERTPAKGVIVKVYGAGTKEEVQVTPQTSMEYIMAHQGYIVYALNVRGTQGFGDDHLRAQGKAEGVTSLVRDVSYFIQMTQQAGAAHPHSAAYLENYPLFSHLIMGKNIPSALTGASFGGYMSMLVATHDEKFTATMRDGTRFVYDHRAAFDAYIPVMGISDVRADMHSRTTASRTRYRTGFDATQNPNWWMDNAFNRLDILGNDIDNAKVSALSRVGLLEKPMLLMHGLVDTNTSPRESLQFIVDAIKTGKGSLVAAYFDKTMGHSYPAGASIKAYYETMLRFMDSVAWAKQQKIPFAFTVSEQESTKRAKDIAWFLTRAINPDISYPYKTYSYFLMQECKRRGVTAATLDSMAGIVWHETKSTDSYLGVHYIKALLALKADDLFKGAEKDVDKVSFAVRGQMEDWQKQAFQNLHLRDPKNPGGEFSTLMPNQFIMPHRYYPLVIPQVVTYSLPYDQWYFDNITRQWLYGKPIQTIQTSRIEQFYAGDIFAQILSAASGLMLPSTHPEFSMVMGSDTSIYDVNIRAYDAKLYNVFLYHLRQQILMDNLDKEILRTSLYDF